MVVGLSDEVADDVNKLTAKFPLTQPILWPTCDEVRFRGMDRPVLFVPPAPVKLKHVILDHAGVPCTPYEDRQDTESLLITPPIARRALNPAGIPLPPTGTAVASVASHIHPRQPANPATGFLGLLASSADLVWDMSVSINPTVGHLATSTAWIWCLLHVLAQPHYHLAPPPQGLYPHKVYKRLQRQTSPYRILNYGYEPQSTLGAPKPIVWTHSWGVSGHWRLQPYGPRGRGLVKPVWISPYLKQRGLPAKPPQDDFYRAN
jgi:hypothetical protein